MPNPFAPHRSVALREVERPDEGLARRLAALGATPADAEAFAEAWGTAAEVGSPGDSALAEMVDAASGREHVPASGDSVGGDRASVAVGLDPADQAVMRSILASPVDVVEAWVGEDLSRARAALDGERSADHPRSTLIRRLERRLGSAG